MSTKRLDDQEVGDFRSFRVSKLSKIIFVANYEENTPNYGSIKIGTKLM